MKIYTLFYLDTGLYNKQLFVLPNDETAKKAMKINLMDPNAINFKNEAMLGNTIIKCLANFSEETGLKYGKEYDVCNLKDLLDDNNRDLEAVKQNKA